jgi:DNA primase
MAAFDADQAGELMAWRLAQQLPGVKRLIPDQSKDWNEQLINSGELKHQSQTNTRDPLMHRLWEWHWAATALGRPEGYLNRITEVAREIVKGTELSEKAKLVMQQDLESAAKSPSLLQTGLCAPVRICKPKALDLEL